MRMMLKAQMPVEKANELIRNGSMKDIIERTMKELEPEAAYFYGEDGLRTALYIFDLKESSEIVRRAELFFMELNAKVYFVPVMNADDLRRGLAQV